MINTISNPILRRLQVMAALMLGLLGSTQAFSEEIPAQTMIRETTDQVLEAMRREGNALEANPEKLYAIIDQLILPRFDFKRMSQWVLGPHWRSASATQRENFAMAFKDLLVRSYSKALIEFRNRNVEFLAPRIRGDDEVTVRAQVDQGGGPKVPIDYEVVRNGDGWKVYDVAINGVSLVINYRSSFSQEVKRSGIDGLIERIKQRNQTGTGAG